MGYLVYICLSNGIYWQDENSNIVGMITNELYCTWDHLNHIVVF